MKLIGNILWMLCGGLLSAACMFMSGLVWCITIVGIPYGIQCFKFAGLILHPFGRDVAYGGNLLDGMANIIWVLFFGMEQALMNLIIGAVLCCTIVGIPFGMQFFKIAKLSFMPFGARIYRV